MRLSRLLLNISAILILPAVIGTVILYLYSAIFCCSFPEPRSSPLNELNFQQNASTLPLVAPFRLLVFGDPQLEGDSSLPDPSDPAFPSLLYMRTDDLFSTPRKALHSIGVALRGLFKQDIPLLLWSYRKRLDLLGNDYYLAHIYRSLHWWVVPSHVAVLGDLLGSQWISDDEFSRRADRYWTRVFTSGARIENSITEGGRTETLGADPAWATRIINVAGNHDIGYSGDITVERMTRFEEAFGRADWDVRFHLPEFVGSAPFDNIDGPPELRIVVLNSMNLDGPAHDVELQDTTYDFINTRLIGEARPVEDTRSATLLLTHVPLHKRAGICVDGPLIVYRPNGVLREQNHLSPGTSQSVLEGIFGMSGRPDAPMGGRGRNGMILTGHDHEGCDVWHHVTRDDAEEMDWHEDNDYSWSASRFSSSNATLSRPGIREITVRSMMGAYGGNAGLLSGWFDVHTQTWQFDYATCPLGVQHYWWAVHVLDVIVVLSGLSGVTLWALERSVDVSTKPSLRNKDSSKEDSAVLKAAFATGLESAPAGMLRRGNIVR